jgi:hypothetical protein
MRKLLLAAAGAAALAISSGAGAVVVVTGATNLNDPNPTAPSSISVNGTTTTINYGQNPLTTPTFNGSFVFNNSEAGLYSIVLNTSTPGTSFTAATLSGLVNGVATTYNLFALDAMNFKLNPSFLSAGQGYTFSFTGNNPDSAASLSGNVTIRQAAVPEPGTWALMLLGFGATGMMIRRRNRRTVFAQVA